MAKPSLPQGTRDFGPDTVRKRNYIFNTIRNVFELYGFQPLETPAMENLDTLMGKYGEEGDKLIFKILDNSDFLKKIPNKNKKFLEAPEIKNSLGADLDKLKSELQNINWDEVAENIIQVFQEYFSDKTVGDIVGETRQYANSFADKALKYDLTIPFARYVAMNHNKLTFPFKRYQIQPVWRADRPQRGRYREFYQCDADVVGSNALLNEVELVNIYTTVFDKLKVAVEVRINNRKILQALAEVCGGTDRMTDITIAIDKLDKIGLDKVKEELAGKGLNEDQITTIDSYLSIARYSGDNETIIDQLPKLFKDSPVSTEGLNEIKFILDNTSNLAFTSKIWIDPTLARGLNYYTGSIFEIKASDVAMGSIGGGGRYDDLTGLFGVPNIPGVGISFGVDRIYDVMEELKLFPDDVHIGTQVLFFNLGEAESKAAFSLMQQLRHKGIRSELFHENSKFDKQFKYAEKKNIPFIIIIGDKELKENSCTIKNLASGEQQTITAADLLNYNF